MHKQKVNKKAIKNLPTSIADSKEITTFAPQSQESNLEWCGSSAG